MTYGGRIEAFFTVPSSITLTATTNAGGPTAVAITAGSYTMTSFVTQLQADLIAGRSVTAGTWTVALSTGTSGTGKITIAVTNGTYTISWPSTDLRDLLGFTATISAVATATSDNCARGVWIPDAPMMIDGNYLAAPRKTDRRSTISPTGFVVSHQGNTRYQHTNLVYSHVPLAKTWIASESVTHSSWERWILDTQDGSGHDWFATGSKFTVRSHDASETLVGNGTVAGWYAPTLGGIEDSAKRANAPWDGHWQVQIPLLCTDS